MKYSFLMPYYRRKNQFHNTLLSLYWWYGDRSDWEVIVVQDKKCVDDLGGYTDPRIHIVRGKQDALNPCVAYNQAAQEAMGTHFIITNPECYHVSDVLEFFDRSFNECSVAYPIAACRHVKYAGALQEYNSMLGAPIMWYQHSVHRNKQYHFCTAIDKNIYNVLGGFDEDYADGYCYDDDDFIDKVYAANLLCKTDDTVLVLHQEHEKLKTTPALRVLLERNRKLFIDKSARRKINSV